MDLNNRVIKRLWCIYFLEQIQGKHVIDVVNRKLVEVRAKVSIIHCCQTAVHVTKVLVFRYDKLLLQ